MFFFFHKFEIANEHAVYLMVSGLCRPCTYASNFMQNRGSILNVLRYYILFILYKKKNKSS